MIYRRRVNKNVLIPRDATIKHKTRDLDQYPELVDLFYSTRPNFLQYHEKFLWTYRENSDSIFTQSSRTNDDIWISIFGMQVNSHGNLGKN